MVVGALVEKTQDTLLNHNNMALIKACFHIYTNSEGG